ncbi:dihydroneopterin aldolase [Streptococcus sp. DD12]|uniref:dihydroneopterin aldolase n=1 Tax=Streptococcus sp. DD12 TaxID=1777880 RepID=UPI000792A009|nr:dihydroneopterin aldolase [Streptococcus sp. DD12]KXT76557.1 Dihydroneopterin aldolase [Streptococcus sp. DD12]
MDVIFLEKCRFYGYHGVLPEETVIGQIFEVTCRLEVDLTAASQSDDLLQTVNYAEVFNLLKTYCETKRYQLLEALAGDIIQAILEAFPTVSSVWLRVGKQNPPIAGHYDQVGIEMSRRRHG